MTVAELISRLKREEQTAIVMFLEQDRWFEITDTHAFAGRVAPGENGEAGYLEEREAEDPEAADAVVLS